MAGLEIVFRKKADLTPEERVQVDEVDRLAFDDVLGGEAEEMEWVAPELHFLGKLEGRVISNVGLITRAILVGGERVTIGGIGGVATLPEMQRHGYAGSLMDEAARYMKEHSDYRYGMLFCDVSRVPYYNRFGYQRIDNPVFIKRNGKTEPFLDICMVLDLRGLPFPKGEVDCQGLPW